MHFIKNNVVFCFYRGRIACYLSYCFLNSLQIGLGSHPEGGGGGEGTQQSFVVLYEDALPQVQTFAQKVTVSYTYHRK